MKRFGVAMLSACGLLAVGAPIAAAHTGTATITCTSVSYSFANFGLGSNTVHEAVLVDGSQVASTDFTFDGASGSNVVAISVPADGKSHVIEADAQWDTNGQTGSFSNTATLTCGGSGATFTPGYWKNHQAQTTALLSQPLGGYTVSTFSEAHAVFAAMNCSNSSSQNAFGCLAGHTLAAELNVANGAATPACVPSTISEANALLSAGGYAGPTGTYSLTASQRSEAISLVGTLDSYNNGTLTC
jgi:hypothetical protein